MTRIPDSYTLHRTLRTQLHARANNSANNSKKKATLDYCENWRQQKRRSQFEPREERDEDFLQRKMYNNGCIFSFPFVTHCSLAFICLSLVVYSLSLPSHCSLCSVAPLDYFSLISRTPSSLCLAFSPIIQNTNEKIKELKKLRAFSSHFCVSSCFASFIE